MDPETGDIEARVDIPPAKGRGISDIVGIAGDADAVWLAENDGERVVRIDPADNTIAGEVGLPFGAEDVWASGPVVIASAEEGIEGQDFGLFRIDPERNRFVDRLPEFGSVVEAEDGLVVVDDSGAVKYMDTASAGEPLALPFPDREFALLGQRIYTLGGDTDRSTLECRRITDGQQCGTLELDGEGWNEVYASDQHVWVVSNAGIARVQPATLHVEAVVDIAEQLHWFAVDFAVVAGDVVWSPGSGSVYLLPTDDQT